MQIMYLKSGFFLEYVKNAYNSTKRQTTQLKYIYIYLNRHFSKEYTGLANRYMKRSQESLVIKKSANQNHNEIPLHTLYGGYH